MNEYKTMKEIGALFGMSSHAVGKALKARGLRTTGGKPSAEAFQGGWVRQKFTFDGANYLWAWNAAKTISLLEQVGMTRLLDTDDSAEPHVLAGKENGKMVGKMQTDYSI